MRRPTVLLAEDHQQVADALHTLLSHDFDVVGTVPNGLMLVAAAAELEPDVIVADVFMPCLDGLGALAELRRANPRVKVIFITMYHEPALARVALDDGACGFVLKHLASEELIDAIRAALEGKTYVSPVLAAKLRF